MRVFKNVSLLFGVFFLFVALTYIFSLLPVRLWWQENREDKVGSLSTTICFGLKVNDRVIFQKCHESEPIQLH